MKIVSISIQNFMAIGKASLSLSDRGLLNVQGVNKDDTSAESNGAGKSSLPDALSWCLYGETARGESGDTVVNRFVGKDCAVFVRIEDDGRYYHTERYRKHKKYKNNLYFYEIDATGKLLTDLTGGKTEITQQTIEQVLGCSIDVFNSAIYAGQEKMPDLPGMTDKKLKLLVEEAAGTTVLEDGYAEARARVQVAEKALEAARNTVNAVHLEISRTTALKDDLDDRRDEFGRLQIEAVKAIQIRAKEYHTQAKKIVVDTVLKAKILTEIAAIDAKLAAIKTEQDDDRRLAGEVSKAEATLSALMARHKSGVDRAAAEGTRFKAVDAELGKPCKDCGRPLTADELKPTKQAIKARYDKERTEVAELAAQITNAQSALETLCDQHDKHRASMTDVSETTKRRSDLREQLSAIEGDEAELKRLTGIVNREIEAAKAKAAEKNPFEPKIAECVSQLAELETQKSDAEAVVAVKEERVAIANACAEVFAPAGVRAHILDTVTPYLNDQTARYLSVLSDGNITANWTTLTKTAKGELREKFAIEVCNAVGGEKFGSISGGEKRKVRVAAALALQDLVASRATKPIDLFIGDEIDEALDKAGLERLMIILEEKARERGTVLVISHNSLRDWISNTIQITKENKVSTVEEMVV